MKRRRIMQHVYFVTHDSLFIYSLCVLHHINTSSSVTFLIVVLKSSSFAVNCLEIITIKKYKYFLS